MGKQLVFVATRFATAAILGIALFTLTAAGAPGNTGPPSAQPTGYVATGRLNVRSGPSKTYNIVTTVDRSQDLTLVGRNQDGSWVQVRLPGEFAGWVQAQFLNVIGDPAALRVTFDSTRVAALPHITVSDSIVSPGKSISVLAEGYLAGETVEAYLYTPEGGLKTPLARAVTDDAGTVQLDMNMPSTWQNGDPITESNLLLVVGTPQSMVNEMISLNYVWGDERVSVPPIVDGVFAAFRSGDLTLAQAYLTGRALARAEFDPATAFGSLTGLPQNPEEMTGLGSQVTQVQGNRLKAEAVLIFDNQYERLNLELVRVSGQYLIEDVYVTGRFWAEDAAVEG